MRHGRSVDALMSANLSRLLDELARDLMTQARDGLIHRKRKLSAVIHAQDIDECFMLLRLQGNPYSTCRRQTLQLKARFLHGRLLCLLFSMLLHFILSLSWRKRTSSSADRLGRRLLLCQGCIVLLGFSFVAGILCCPHFLEYMCFFDCGGCWGGFWVC